MDISKRSRDTSSKKKEELPPASVHGRTPMTPEEEPGDPPPTIAKEPAINPKIILTGPGISIIPK